MTRSSIMLPTLLVGAAAFSPSRSVMSTFVRAQQSCHAGSPVVMADTASAETETETETALGVKTTPIDPKDAAKIFGRLAEKYIMLDSSGGMCCYSGCSDCEFRNPEGGYIMADQSAARPKWIPCYEEKSYELSGKEHTSKWSAEIFTDGPGESFKPFFLQQNGRTELSLGIFA